MVRTWSQPATTISECNLWYVSSDESRCLMESIMSTLSQAEQRVINDEASEYLIPVDVIRSIVRSFRNDALDILNGELHHAGDHFYFNRFGMYIGVEYDGYIHT